MHNEQGNNILRRTKIVTTLGPATDKDGVLEGILDAGANVVRINFSHGNKDEHLARVAAVKKYSNRKGIYIGVLMDLQGPKIRIGSFIDKKVSLDLDDKFILDVDFDINNGNKERVGLSYKLLPKDVNIGSILLLDDGKIKLEVSDINNNEIHCIVRQAGVLLDKKGINLLGGGLSAKALTKKDKQDILTVAKAKANYVALSFTSSGDDIREVKKLLKESGSDAEIIAKIERIEALEEDVIKDIILESAGIMVARGDLGVEIGDPMLPAQQKRLIKLARENDKVVITATQMLDSMINSPVPTRAEVFDIANAVLDGTDAIMLSAETASGNFPVNAVKVIHDVCLEAEKNPIAKKSHHRLNTSFKYIDESIAMSAMYAGNHIGAKIIVALTGTGKTTLLMSRISSNIAIFAMSDKEKTLEKVTLYRGVYPCYLSQYGDWNEIDKNAVKKLKDKGIISNNDLVILTKGMYKGDIGGTNLMKIINTNC